QVATKTTLKSDHPKSAASGQPVVFTAMVASQSAAQGPPTGTVQFALNGHSVGAPVSLSDGQASITLASLTVGNDNVTAVYSSDVALFLPSSTATPLRQTIVSPLVKPPHGIALEADPNHRGKLALVIAATPGNDRIHVQLLKSKHALQVEVRQLT